MKNKEIPEHILSILADRAIMKEAESDNIELGHALKHISEEQLRDIVTAEKPKIHAPKRMMRERLFWGLSVAAMLIVAITIPLRMNRESSREIDDIIYSYNSDILRVPLSDPRSSGAEINIAEMSEAQLKDALPELESRFKQCEENQEVAITGQILSLAYIRLHNREGAKSTLQSMIKRLSTEKEDYQGTIDRCEEILKWLK